MALFPTPLSANETKTLVITGSYVNIRTGPGTDYTLLNTYSEGTKLPVLSQQDGWYQVKLPDGTKGWIIDDYAKLVSNPNVEDDSDTQLKIQVNGRQINFDSPPYIDNNNRTMVPIRFIIEELGASISWDGEEQKVNISFNNKEVTLWIGKNTAKMNGSELKMDTQPVLKDARTLVPLRFISEAIGSEVGWDEKTNIVSINMQLYPQEVFEGIVKENVVNVRTGPDMRYPELTKLSEGTRVELTSSETDSNNEVWYKVKLSQDSFGWIAGWLVQIIDEDEQEPSEGGGSGTQRETALVIGNVVNVRSGPGLSNEVVSKVNVGDSLPVLSQDQDWYQVKLSDHKAGWIYGPLVSIQSEVVSRGSDYYRDYVGRLPATDLEYDYPTLTNVLFEIIDDKPVIFIQGNTQLSPSSFTLGNPRRLVVDIPNTQISGVPPEQREETIANDIISSIRVGQLDNETSRVVLDLNKPASYSLESFNDGQVVGIFLTTAVLHGKTIVLDPGHGGISASGFDSGAIGPSGTQESQVVLEIALKTAQLLKEQGAEVVMTRTGTTYLDLYGRSDLANRVSADLFVSIHANASYSSTAKGSSVYFYASGNLEYQNSERVKLARAILNNVVKTAGTVERGVHERSFAVIRTTNMPSILVETAFISNPQEEALLNDDNFQTKMAQSIASGIADYYRY